MKHLIIILSILSIIRPAVGATVKGYTVNKEGKGVEFVQAIMVAKDDSTIMYGDITEVEGHFSIDVPDGDYCLKLYYYNDLGATKSITVKGYNVDLGKIVLALNMIIAKGVIVRPELIHREPDRFILNIASSPLALGRSASEILSTSPGVWVSPIAGISINGRSGTKVMIDERLLRESGQELVNYLNTIRAEDIQSVEIIPIVGADQDAGQMAGLIKIKLKKQRAGGLDGSVSISASQSVVEKQDQSIQPSGNLRYKKGDLSLYSRLNYRPSNGYTPASQSIDYANGDRLTSSSNNSTNSRNIGGQLGAVYDINTKQSLGVEANYSNNKYLSDMVNRQLINTLSSGRSDMTDILSTFDINNRSDQISFTGNYLLKLDTLGSLLKLVVDYSYQDRDNNQNSRSVFSGYITKDTLYRNMIATNNNIFSASLDVDKKISQRSTIKTGLKYSHSGMNNSNTYESYVNNHWDDIMGLSSLNEYNENIGAAYFIYSTKFKNRMAINAGLRGEYTFAVPSTSSTVITNKQNYFGIFPSVYFLTPLSKTDDHLLSLSYSRKIQRPSFRDLNPWRYPLGEYSYVEGNQYLKPVYINDVSISYIFKQKYNLTFGVGHTKDAIEQVSSKDPDNPLVIIYQQRNTNNSLNVYMNINLPVKIYDWWYLNSNITGLYLKNKIENNIYDVWRISGNLTNMFTLVKDKSFLELRGWYQGPDIYGNMVQTDIYQIDLGYKKIFKDNKFVLTCYVNDLLNIGGNMRTTVVTPDYQSIARSRWGYTNISVSFTYNFKMGKQVRMRRVESGAEDEKGRL